MDTDRFCASWVVLLCVRSWEGGYLWPWDVCFRIHCGLLSHPPMRNTSKSATFSVVLLSEHDHTLPLLPNSSVIVIGSAKKINCVCFLCF